MNGSRSAHPRHGDRDRSSLDALSRTIEGLEARIQGLMAGGRAPAQAPAAAPQRAIDDNRQPHMPAGPDPRAKASPAGTGYAERARDPLAEIRERQRMLEQAGQSSRRFENSAAMPVAPARAEQRSDQRTGTRREDIRQPAVATRVAEANQRRADIREFTETLSGLRQDLKRDISEGVSHEMRSLKEEVRAIRAQAEGSRFTQDVQADLARLAQGIDQLAMQSAPGASGLRSEFEDLRSVMDGLARQESLRQMQDQWVGLEERLQDADTSALREELVALAYRVDEIRNQLGVMADSPTIRALEQKLLALAGMMEQLGSRMKPNDAAITEQFSQLDHRLDEISRAIAANSRASAANTQDELAMQRLQDRIEDRLAGLMEQVETIGRYTADQSATDGLSMRIELLAGRIEEMAEEQATAQLQERIEQLSVLVQQMHAPGRQEDVTNYLSDISRKIDALDTSFSAEGLGERLDYLSRRIDEMEHQPRPADDDGAFVRIEDRLSAIAAQLDEATSAPRNDDEALRGLEAQIANLSTLISQPSSAPAAWPPEFDNRMAAIEGYMATNDEYIVEAARQAAEAVVEAYSRNLGADAPGTSGDMAALAALADDLKHLEELTRGSESRTHQTFEALHGTLVQIAERLDQLEGQFTTAPAVSYRNEEPVRQPAFTAAPIQRDMPVAREAVLSADVAQELAGTEMPRTEARLRETSAIGSTMADHVPAMLSPVDAETNIEDETKPARKSLLGGLAKRLRPGSKQEKPAKTRTFVDPTPSIDPSADDAVVAGDTLESEGENDLLEPGSGAPDVRKILERVRASQAAGEFGAERGGDRTGDRADYIAAARRAAKAAAQEADPSQMGSLAKAKPAKAKPAVGKAEKEKGVSAFSRHRRPILMAVGAVLLALMAMPLIKTVTSGSPAPQVASVEQPVIAAAPEASAPTPAALIPQTPTASEAPVLPQSAAPEITAPPTEQMANAPEAAAPQATDSDVAAEAPAENLPAAPIAPVEHASIVVPAGIEPQSMADAAAAGDANALFEIGARFSDGRGVTTDLGEAAKWYKLAADRGLAPAQYRMGNLLEKGTGVERNLGEAISYYRQAAQAGNASAMHNLAVLYASGAAGQPDYAAAVEWFRKASELGVADSQFNLAILYARGNGVKQDLEESYKWFGVAAKGGDTDAAAKQEEVGKAMRKEQLDSARAKLNSWTAKPLDPNANAVNLPDEWASGKKLTTASIDMTKAIRNIQAILNKNGFDAGTPDGKMGAKTVAAIKSFQNSIGQEPTGKVDDAMVRELLKRNG
ncbi:hemagglutinin [Rhizobium wenxiniae]|uniref:Localization factor PodJL n=1 Tax=Rhizobium wenxiniae TaxID=1737357 RepID=A0A7W9Y6E7_9HYPH|nr:peptidoglycan-binding protein [Rhizobium wenxiniae]MBB6162842.1 localization factor PodJL [Rhizobium wenxiniae]GGF95432.1 hemagglutinin [Rhizobium wenxiniae]